MKATIFYKGLTVEIEGTPEEIAQYTDILSKELNQLPDSTARVTMIWQPPMWYEHYANAQGVWESSILNTIIQNGAAQAINPYQQFYDKWYQYFYNQVGGANLINPYQQFYKESWEFGGSGKTPIFREEIHGIPPYEKAYNVINFIYKR